MRNTMMVRVRKIAKSKHMDLSETLGYDYINPVAAKIAADFRRTEFEPNDGLRRYLLFKTHLKGSDLHRDDVETDDTTDSAVAPDYDSDEYPTTGDQ